MSYIFCESLVSRNAPFLHIVLYIWYKSSLLILLKCPIILFPTAGLYFICLSISSIRSRPPNASCSSRKQNPFTADNTPPSFIHLWVSRRVLRGVSVCNCKGSTAPRKRFQNWHVFQWLLLLCFLSGTMNLKFPAKRSNASFPKFKGLSLKSIAKVCALSSRNCISVRFQLPISSYGFLYFKQQLSVCREQLYGEGYR